MGRIGLIGPISPIFFPRFLSASRRRSRFLGNDQFWFGPADLGGLSAPITTPDGTAYKYVIQDVHHVPGDNDRIWK